MISDETHLKVYEQTHSQVGNCLLDKIKFSIYDQAETQIWAKIRNLLFIRIHIQVVHQFEEAFKEEFKGY